MDAVSCAMRDAFVSARLQPKFLAWEDVNTGVPAGILVPFLNFVSSWPAEKGTEPSLWKQSAVLIPSAVPIICWISLLEEFSIENVERIAGDQPPPPSILSWQVISGLSVLLCAPFHSILMPLVVCAAQLLWVCPFVLWPQQCVAKVLFLSKGELSYTLLHGTSEPL